VVPAEGAVELRVSRSIADLAGAGGIAAAHVAEAVRHRRP
jgi:predicted ATPase with chaperone activity